MQREAGAGGHLSSTVPSAPIILRGDLKEPSAATTCAVGGERLEMRGVRGGLARMQGRMQARTWFLRSAMAALWCFSCPLLNTCATRHDRRALRQRLAQCAVRHLADAAAPPHVLLLLLRPPRVVGGASNCTLLYGGIVINFAESLKFFWFKVPIDRGL